MNIWLFLEQEAVPFLENLAGQLLLSKVQGTAPPTPATDAEAAALSLLNTAESLHAAGNTVTVKTVTAADSATLAGIAASSSKSPLAQVAATAIADAGASEAAGQAGGPATTPESVGTDVVAQEGAILLGDAGSTAPAPTDAG